ncbi:MAG: DUF3179 domain-containing protein [Chloroflexi bacterium]|nr:DUF3179 domain-containing protein [Chloroflexota bacterium]
MKAISLVLIIYLSVVLLAGCAQGKGTPGKTPELSGTQEDAGVKVTAGGVKYIVDPSKIVAGGPPKDGIPSIDNPRYVSLQDADGWIKGNELVLGIVYKGVKRAYPLQIMVWHEIVNDDIAGDPLLITY